MPQAKDRRVLLVPVGCGKCIECRKQKAREWQVRMSEEIKHDKRGKFVTLTFSNEGLEELEEAVTWQKVRVGIKKVYKLRSGETRNKYLYEKRFVGNLDGYELDNAVAKLGMRRFLERWRKEFGKSCKHWFVSELGGTSTERIHLHGIMFTDEVEAISKHWKYGVVSLGRHTRS